MAPVVTVQGNGNKVDPRWADWVAEQIYDIWADQHVSMAYRRRQVSYIRSWLRDVCTPGETVDVFALYERWANPPAPVQPEPAQ